GREAAPCGVPARIEDIAFDPAFLFQTRPDAEDLADIAGRGVKRAVGCGKENGDLIDREGDEGRIERTGFDAVQVAFVAGADQKMAIAIERERINDIVSAGPEAFGGAVTRNHIDIR